MAFVNTPYIDKIKLPTGTEYYIHDTETYDLLSQLSGGAMVFGGVSTAAVTDGSTTNPIGGITGAVGTVILYGNKEFVWDGTAWREFGDMTGHGALAFKDSATGTTTPAGTVSVPTATFSGTVATITSTGRASQ